jgi:hypothetical protein
MTTRTAVLRAFAISIGAHLAAVIVILGVIFVLARPSHAQQGIAPNPDLLTACNQSVIYDSSASGSTRIVVGTATKQIYVCGFTFFASGTVNVDLIYGTGGTCGTGATKITPAFQFTAQTGLIDHLPVYQGLVPVPVSNDLCLNTSGAVAFQAIVYFSQW